MNFISDSPNLHHFTKNVFWYSSKDVILNKKKYTFIKMGQYDMDSIGYFRRVGSKLLYLDYRDVAQPDKKEQLIIDFTMNINDTIHFSAEGLLHGRNTFFVKDIQCLQNNRVFVLERVDALSTVPFECCYLRQMSIGENTGFIEFVYDMDYGPLMFYSPPRDFRANYER